CPDCTRVQIHHPEPGRYTCQTQSAYTGAGYKNHGGLRMNFKIIRKYKLEIIFAVVVIVFTAVFLIQNANIQANAKPGQETWQGSDDMGSAAIEATGYTPWIQPLWTPPSTEVESLLFSIQSGLGAFVIGYFFGFYRGKRDSAKPA